MVRPILIPLLFSALAVSCVSMHAAAPPQDDIIDPDVQIHHVFALDGALIEEAFGYLQSLDDPHFAESPHFRCYSVGGIAYTGSDEHDLRIRFGTDNWALEREEGCETTYSFTIDFLNEEIVGCSKSIERFAFRCGPGELVSLNAF